MEYIEIKEQIKQKLPVARDLGDSENLLELGLSSLTIMRLVNQWRKQGVKVSFGSLMENPTLEGWWALIQRSMKKKAGKKRAQESKITPEKDMKQPFPLTDVQYAYWVGRDEEQALGGIDCHAYLEFDGGNIDPERLEKAWNVLQYHHPMLRACFLDDGTQKILDKPYCEKIKVHDFSRMSSEEAEAMAVSVRERLSHRKLKIEEGEVAGIELTLFPENKARLHVDMALLVADVQSLQILLRDLASAYRGENLPKESKGWNFASYLERQKQEEGEERKNAEKYWKNRLEHLPKGPDLPLAKRPQEVEKTVFNRRIVRIEKEEWDHLQMRAKKYQTTPAMVLLTAYAVVLERWSRNHCFLINIPFFNRKTEQQGLEEVIADFTTLLLLEINCEENPTFAELLDRIQKQLHEDMKYTAYSGVQVQRDIAQMCGDASAVAPVVFACNLGTPLVNDTFRNELGQFSYMISQTPQVWNDFQSYEDENGVQLTWDSVDELFPENMIPDMLESFEILLHELGKKDWNQRFDVLPEKRKREIEDTARTGVPERVECLHWAVMNHAEVCPEDIALIDAGSGRSVSYGELKARATAVAAGISEKDIKGVPVALTLPRGIEQIESALGILLSGNSYLPVSLSQPKDRRALIHEKTGVRYVVTNRELSEKLDWPEGTEILVMEGMEEGQENVRLPEVSPKDSAYIIMTSGSTGVPKGVEIAHESAWNTVQDINEKYHVTSADRALAVSAMDFDLSVYDVFGILGAGGTLVLLPEQERRNADYWLEQVLKYQITVWNSVPVLLDMLLIRAESMKQKLPIRAVMLSGDWIGMDLPQRVAAWTEDCQFVAMGGATEASIWSNYQNVTLPMPKNWKSIPYGKPLRYQAYRVVDEYGRDCPYWAEGELWIGGFGVAKGYRGDGKALLGQWMGVVDEELRICPEYVSGQIAIGGYSLAEGYLGDTILTKEKFVYLEEEKNRIYLTGDNGRYVENGDIEFLGRLDNQVKINGHRIEIAEIENAIRGMQNIEDCCVVYNQSIGKGVLIAFIKNKISSISYTKEEYRKQLAFFLPPAMIPSEFVNVESFPLSTNGKIDRKGLAESIQKNIKVKHNAKATLISQKKEYVELAKSIKKIVCSISGNDYIDYEDNLLENGLDSLLLSQISGRIVSDIQEAQGMRFDEILRASLTMPTIMGIAQYISDCKNPSKNQMHSNAGNQTRNSYTVVYIFGDNENEIRDVLIEKLSASNISCKRVGGQEIIERCHEDINVKKKYIIAFSEMASLCITKASELLGENIIINRIFLINPSKAKESDLYLGDISIIDGNSVAIKSWEKAVLGNVREFESNSNDIFDIIMRELENDK